MVVVITPYHLITLSSAVFCLLSVFGLFYLYSLVCSTEIIKGIAYI